MAQASYDPLSSPDPGTGRPHVASYWVASAGAPPADDGPVPGPIRTEVAIIGGGYTGLACAHALAGHGIQATVLEANRPGWGCSGRNGGFVRPSIGKLGYQRMIDRWGAEITARIYAEAREALLELRHLIVERQLDCGLVDGYFKVAHRAERCAALEEEARLMRDRFGYEAALLSADEFRRDHANLSECHGALLFPDYFAVHPLKLTYGLLTLAREAGAVVHTGATVRRIARNGPRYHLATPGGEVIADKVVLATNGYTSEHLHPALRARIMPILSHIIVTRPLDAGELAACNFRSRSPIVDTRQVNHYYRLLADNRILLGSRGAIGDVPRDNDRQRDYLLKSLRRKFPALAGITIDYDWNGWVCLTQDWIPHVYAAPDEPGFHYALGYGGGGVAFAARAGRLVAARIAGVAPDLDIPTATSPLRRFPFARFRRLGQRIALNWLELMDKRE